MRETRTGSRWPTGRSPSWSPKVEETETVTLSAQQGQVGVALTATYNDLDKEMPDGTDSHVEVVSGRLADGGSESMLVNRCIPQ